MAAPPRACRTRLAREYHHPPKPDKPAVNAACRKFLSVTHIARSVDTRGRTSALKGDLGKAASTHNSANLVCSPQSVPAEVDLHSPVKPKCFGLV